MDESFGVRPHLFASINALEALGAQLQRRRSSTALRPDQSRFHVLLGPTDAANMNTGGLNGDDCDAWYFEPLCLRACATSRGWPLVEFVRQSLLCTPPSPHTWTPTTAETLINTTRCFVRNGMKSKYAFPIRDFLAIKQWLIVQPHPVFNINQTANIQKKHTEGSKNGNCCSRQFPNHQTSGHRNSPSHLASEAARLRYLSGEWVVGGCCDFF